MAVKDTPTTQFPTPESSRFDKTGALVPGSGKQPWYDWLIQTLLHVDVTAASFFQVRKDDADDVTVRVMPGRLTLDGTVLVYAGGTVDLSDENNDTAYIWLYNDGGTAKIGHGSDAAGWPSTRHIKLAEVTLAAGSFAESDIVDRRPESIIQDNQAAAVTDIASPGSATAEDCANKINELMQNLRDAGLLATS